MGSGSIHHRLRMRPTGLLLRGVELALAGILGAMLARMLWLVIEPSGIVSRPGIAALVTPPAGAEMGGMGADRSVLIRENAFGRAQLDPVQMDAPETKLNFRLVGVRASASGEGGSATLIGPEGRQGRYLPGDEIIPNVRLQRIFPDRVLLDHNGSPESLFLGDSEGRLSVLGGQQARVEGMVSPSGDSGVRRHEISEDFLSAFAVAPSTDDAGRRVYILNPRGNPAAFLGAGFIAGDIITGVNGESPDSLPPEEFLARIRNDERVMLDIRRGGHTLRIELVVS